MWAPGWLVCRGKALSQRVFCTLLELASPGRGGLSPVKCQSIKNLENKKRGLRRLEVPVCFKGVRFWNSISSPSGAWMQIPRCHHI